MTIIFIVTKFSKFIRIGGDEWLSSKEADSANNDKSKEYLHQ